MFFHAGDIPGQLTEFTGKGGRIEIRGLAPGHPPGMASQPGQRAGNPTAHGQTHQQHHNGHPGLDPDHGHRGGLGDLEAPFLVMAAQRVDDRFQLPGRGRESGIVGTRFVELAGIGAQGAAIGGDLPLLRPAPPGAAHGFVQVLGGVEQFFQGLGRALDQPAQFPHPQVLQGRRQAGIGRGQAAQGLGAGEKQPGLTVGRLGIGGGDHALEAGHVGREQLCRLITQRVGMGVQGAQAIKGFTGGPVVLAYGGQIIRTAAQEVVFLLAAHLQGFDLDLDSQAFQGADAFGQPVFPEDDAEGQAKTAQHTARQDPKPGLDAHGCGTFRITTTAVSHTRPGVACVQVPASPCLASRVGKTVTEMRTFFHNIVPLFTTGGIFQSVSKAYRNSP